MAAVGAVWRAVTLCALFCVALCPVGAWGVLWGAVRFYSVSCLFCCLCCCCTTCVQAVAGSVGWQAAHGLLSKGRLLWHLVHITNTQQRCPLLALLCVGSRLCSAVLLCVLCVLSRAVWCRLGSVCLVCLLRMTGMPLVAVPLAVLLVTSEG